MSLELQGCRGVKIARHADDGKRQVNRTKFPYVLTIVQRLTEETHSLGISFLLHGGHAVVVAYGKSPEALKNFMKRNNLNEQSCRVRTISGPEGETILD